MSKQERKRERDRETERESQAGSTEADVGLEATNCEIMT